MGKADERSMIYIIGSGENNALSTFHRKGPTNTIFDTIVLSVSCRRRVSIGYFLPRKIVELCRRTMKKLRKDQFSRKDLSFKKDYS
jgi:hypothetical protein